MSTTNDEVRVYPGYRKFQNGKEFVKISGPKKMISVLKTPHSYRIICTENNMQLQDAFNPDISMPATADEFEKMYHEAIWHVNKANI
jgi:hypothetical protein